MHDLPPQIRLAKRLAYWMDEAFRIPFTQQRVGLDPILGLFPAAGDLIVAIVSLYIVALAIYYQLPWRVVFKMLWNVVLDFLSGCVPVLGDILDMGFKSNAKNASLLEHYYRERSFVGGDYPVIDVTAEAI